jgi:N6-adenosine-specific RNA methylase IME4
VSNGGKRTGGWWRGLTSPMVEVGCAKFATILIDPPWDYDDENDGAGGCLGRGRPDYAPMPFEKIMELPVSQLADIDSHLYLWVTNRSMPKGFALLEKWGFRYVTCITWCKPTPGMGNYFRGATEHMLFGVKGSQQLLRKDAPTWFQADRGTGGHSSKPEESYRLVESCSRGPYLEMFARKPRNGWSQWGEKSKRGAAFEEAALYEGPSPADADLLHSVTPSGLTLS